MTQAHIPTAAKLSVAPLCLRACGAGAGVASVLSAVVLASGAVPQAAAGPVLAGAAAAVATGCAGTAFQVWMATVPGDHPTAGPRYLLGLFGNFGLQSLVLAVACAGFLWVGTKFETTAAFGLAFAAAAMAVHVTGAVMVARALRARALGPPAAAPDARGARTGDGDT